MKKILVFLCFISTAALAQNPSYKKMMHNPSVNFYTVCEAAESYFKTIDKEKKGSGWKPFQRWKEANEFKYYPSGDRSSVDPYFVSKQYEKFITNYGSSHKLFPNGWNEVGPVSIDSITGHYAAGLGRIEDMHVAPTNPNRIYLGSRSGGLWKSNDAGQTWSSGNTDNLFASGVNTFSVSPTNPDSILINVQNAQNGISHGIYRSVDGANTWSQTNFNPTTINLGGLGSFFKIYEIVYHPRVPNLVFVGTSSGLFRSDDNLQTWTQLYNPNDITDFAFHPTDDNVIYMYNNESQFRNVILKSTDLGLTFSSTATLVGNNNTTNLEISTSADCPSCLYAATSNGVWKSTDAGASFDFMSNPAQSCRGFAVSDLDTSVMIYGYVDLEQSTDGGKNFNQVTYWSLGNTNGAGNGLQNSYRTSTDYIHADVRNAKCLNGVFYVTTDGFLTKSTDNGITWQILSDKIGIRENYRIGVSQSNHYKVVCGSQDNGTSVSIQDGWVEFYGADGMEAIVHPLNEDWFMGSVQFGNRRRTTNGGISQGGGSPAGSNAADWIAPLAFDPNNHMVVYDFRDSIYKSEDFGDNHINLGKPATFTGNIKHAAIAENNSNIIVIARNSSIAKSVDGGQTFVSIKNNLPTYNIEDIAFDPQDDETIFVVFGHFNADNRKIYMSTNGGTLWSNITHNLGSMPIRSITVDHTPARNIYVGAEIGVYTMPMGSTTWSLYNTNLPNVSVRELNINYGSNTLKAATWGRGLWEYSLVGREDYPAIVHTTITSPPTTDRPKIGVDQTVSSKISYQQTLSNVYLEWSTGSPIFGNQIAMTNSFDSTWQTVTPIPNVAVGTKVYFKVVAVGSSNDTSETYKFMYTQQPFEYCGATGHDRDGNYFITDVVFESINNSSTNDGYTLYSNPVVTLKADSTYSLDISANTSWARNDYAAWIDFDGNREFTPDEEVLWFIDTATNNVVNQFSVPWDCVDNDTVTMRIRLSHWGTTPRPCGSQYGEVEDYKILLKNDGRPLQVQSLNNDLAVNIFPNPTSDRLHINFEKQESHKYSLRNQIGQEILNGTFQSIQNHLDLGQLASGVYILSIDKEIFKVIKKD